MCRIIGSRWGIHGRRLNMAGCFGSEFGGALDRWLRQGLDEYVASLEDTDPDEPDVDAQDGYDEERLWLEP